MIRTAACSFALQLIRSPLSTSLPTAPLDRSRYTSTEHRPSGPDHSDPGGRSTSAFLRLSLPHSQGRIWPTATTPSPLFLFLFPRTGPGSCFLPQSSQLHVNWLGCRAGRASARTARGPSAGQDRPRRLLTDRAGDLASCAFLGLTLAIVISCERSMRPAPRLCHAYSSSRYRAGRRLKSR